MFSFRHFFFLKKGLFFTHYFLLKYKKVFSVFSYSKYLMKRSILRQQRTSQFLLLLTSYPTPP